VRVLDLFSGLEGWSEPFRAAGHPVVSVDIEAEFEPDLVADVITLTPGEVLERLGGYPDLVLAGPPCDSFSQLAVGRHWTRNTDDPPDAPKSRSAVLGLRCVQATLSLVEWLKPAYWIMENPRGKLRNMAVVEGVSRRTVTYCQYGFPYMKPTDLFGAFPPSLVLRPACKNGDSCHIAAPRGSRSGIQGDSVASYFYKDLPSGEAVKGKRLAALRAKIPTELSLDVMEAVERDLEAGRPALPSRLPAQAVFVGT
jgi:hypothetical protein